MVSNKIAQLSEYEIRYIESLLGAALSKETSLTQKRMVLSCLNAMKSQRELNTTLSVKW